MDLDTAVIKKWLTELGTSREALPYELVQVVSTDEPQSVLSAIEIAVQHINRALDFELPFKVEVESDQVLFDVSVRLDNYGYYASMAIPFLRQVLEGEFGYPSKEDCLLSWLPEYSAKLSDAKNKGIYSQARALADGFRLLRAEIKNLTDANGFARWSNSCLYLFALLVAASVEYSWSGLSSTDHVSER